MTRLVSKKIFFHFPYRSFSLKNRRLIQVFIEDIFKKEGKKADKINFVFCGKKEVRRLNLQHLQHDYFTDILTFPYTQKPSPVLADIFISPEEVLVNSKRYNTSFNREIHRVIFHGILHLCGYRDKSKKEKQVMRFMEEHYLQEFFGIVPRETSRVKLNVSRGTSDDTPKS
jgi:probable rRNA maturation factor